MARSIATYVAAVLLFLSCGLRAETVGGLSSADLARAVEAANHTPVAIASQEGRSVNGSHIAIYQYGLASVVVGSTEGGQHVGYRLEILAIVPADIPDDILNEMHREVPDSVASQIQHLVRVLDSYPGIEDRAATTAKPDESATSHFSAFALDLNKKSKNLFVSTSKEFAAQFDRRFPKYHGKAFLAVGLRPCAEPNCPLTHEGQVVNRFGKLYGWMKSVGLTKANQAYILSSAGSFNSVTTQLQSDYLWQAELSQVALSTALINAAKKARQDTQSLTYSAAEMAQLPREAVAHIGDVFDSAYAAATSLKSDPSASLVGISDELGRARIRECVGLRGAFNPDSLGACAGYRLTPTVISKCLSNDICTPAFGGAVNLDSLMLTARTNWHEFAQQAPLPRVPLGNFEQLGSAVTKCAGQGENTGYCVVKTSLQVRNPQIAATLNCVETAHSDQAMLVKCATKSLPPMQRAQVACISDYSGDYKKQAFCAARDSLPPQAQKFVACASELQKGVSLESAAGCLNAVKGSREAACLAQNTKDWEAATTCIAGGHLPPNVNAAITCGKKSSSLTDFGVCMVATQGSGEAQRIAACYVEGQGSPAAVAVCLESRNLTFDQRVVLECAAETNGALPATAVCTGGKMLMRDLNDCHGHKFGEGPCFGEGNEIRKLAKKLGFPIGPHSVVADVMNVQLRIVDATGTPILRLGSEAVTQFMEVGERTGMIPDLKKPITWLGPSGKLIENYCQHNSCPNVHLSVGGHKFF